MRAFVDVLDVDRETNTVELNRLPEWVTPGCILVELEDGFEIITPDEPILGC